jgi:hypothetical protein
MTATNLEQLATATDTTPVVNVADDGSVTITVHSASATLIASGESIPATARKLLDALDA